MLTFKETADPHSLQILCNERNPIGHIHWYPNQEPGVTLRHSFSKLTVKEMEQCIAELKKRTN